jgi:hypothetical protein
MAIFKLETQSQNDKHAELLQEALPLIGAAGGVAAIAIIAKLIFGHSSKSENKSKVVDMIENKAEDAFVDFVSDFLKKELEKNISFSQMIH